MSDYSEKLRDPRWQKMRLEILQRDDWTCQICQDKETTLNVHHRYYEAGLSPWEYPPEALVTLCESCHEKEGDGARVAEWRLLRSIRSLGAYNADLITMADYIDRMNPDDSHRLRWPKLSADLRKRIAELLSSAMRRA